MSVRLGTPNISSVLSLVKEFFFFRFRLLLCIAYMFPRSCCETWPPLYREMLPTAGSIYFFVFRKCLKWVDSVQCAVCCTCSCPDRRDNSDNCVSPRVGVLAPSISRPADGALRCTGICCSRSRPDRPRQQRIVSRRPFSVLRTRVETRGRKLAVRHPAAVVVRAPTHRLAAATAYRLASAVLRITHS